MADKLYNTIHIFGFGIVKVIGNGFNYQIQGSMVQMELDSCINNVMKINQQTQQLQIHITLSMFLMIHLPIG